MADNNSRSARARDPLAELARLIGQGDPSSGAHSRESYDSVRPRPSTARNVDRAPEDRYAAPEPHDEARYAPPLPSAPSYPSPSPDYYSPHQAQDPGYQYHGYQDSGYQDRGYQDQSFQDQGYQDEGYQDQGYQDHSHQDHGHEQHAGSRFFSGLAGQFNGFREEPGQGVQRYDDQEPPQLPRDLLGYPNDHGYQADEQHYAEDEAAPADHDYQETRSSGRRTALVAVMAVFGLVVVGSAGAFGYRAMFGGSVLPTLPPIIKATNGPNKIALDPQGGAGNAAQAVATTGSTENLVSREEQPVTIEAPKPAPRVVSTIPIVTNGQGALPPGMSGVPPATIGQNGPNRVAAADPPWPAPPPTSPAPAASTAPAVPPPAPAPAPVSSEPKKIHTVTIRSDQTGAVRDSAAVPPAARAQARPAAAPKAGAANAAGGAAPMSIVPGQGDAAPAPRTRTALAPAVPGAAPAPAGGSYVQVTSRRTEGEAQAEFRALQAKFPGQLNGREAVIRRADLGEKGVYYRAYVGPFASTEEAAQLCSGLKAAGGNCIVQRN